MSRRCVWCGTPLRPTARRDARYCGAPCRKAAHLERHAPVPLCALTMDELLALVPTVDDVVASMPSVGELLEAAAAGMNDPEAIAAALGMNVQLVERAVGDGGSKA